MSHHSTLNPTGWFSKILQTNHIGAIFALVISFTLTACGGGEDPTDIGPEPGADGTAPTLTSVTLQTEESGLQYAELGQTVVVSFTASESLMKPSVTINGETAEVSGQHNSWSGERVMTADDADGNVTFEITFTDVSGVAGTAVTTSTLASNDDGSVTAGWASIEYCADGSCVVIPIVEKILDFEDSTLSYNWKDIGLPNDAPDRNPGTLSEIIADPTDATNTVASSEIEAAGKGWAGAYLVVGETTAPDFSLNLSALDPVISVKTWSDSPVGTKVSLKIEDAADGSKNVVATAFTAVSEGWDTLYFDFSDPTEGAIDPAVEYGAFLMMWGGITDGKPAASWYWDDITHGGVEIPDGANVDPNAGSTIATWNAFSGASIVDGVYTFPSTADSWAGFSNSKTDLYPFTFPFGGKVTFTAAVPDGGNADVRFRFEANPYPNVDPAENTAAVTVTGATEAEYSVDIPANATNTYNSFLMYLDTKDVGVIIKDVEATATDPYAAWNAFSGASIVDGVYTFPSTADSWAGFSNGNADLYPLSFATDHTITFTAAVPDGGNADVRFRFEANPYPNVDPAHNTPAVTVTGATEAEYTIAVPADSGGAGNTYNSYLMYLDTKDVGVTIKNVIITED